jgi:hypothetical protein
MPTLATSGFNIPDTPRSRTTASLRAPMTRTVHKVSETSGARAAEAPVGGGRPFPALRPGERARGGRFERALARAGKQRAAAEGGDGSAAGSPGGGGVMAPWSRPEGPASPEARRTHGSPRAEPAAPCRVLVGWGAGGAEARLSIGSGPLAGAEIHLREGPGGVEAALLTRTLSSRQTLALAMEEVGKRLKQKGHDLRVGWAAPSDSPAEDAGPPGQYSPRKAR